MRFGVVVLAGALASTGPVRAAPSESDFLDELPVVLSVSRMSQPVNEAPAAITVIDRDMIRASGLRDIPDLLRLVPGFTVAYTRDNTWAAGYHGLGDAYSRRFQVLVDGRSIYSPHYGAVNWSELPLSVEDIERIEVVRGPDAAVYGANAFAAVINIITRTAAQAAGAFVSLQAGEQSMRGLTVRRGGGNGALRYRLTASAQQRDRFERDVTHKPAVSRDNGRYFEAGKTYFVNGRMDWQRAPDSEVMAQFGLSQGDWNAGRRTDNPLSALEPTRQDARALYLQLAWRKVESARREWRVQAYHSQNRFDGRMDWQRAPDSEVMAQFGLSQGDWNAGRRTDNPLSALEPTRQDARALYLQLAWRKVESARREWRVQAYHSQNRFDADALVNPGVGPIDVNQALRQSRSSIDLQVNEQWTPDLRAVWGGEVWQESVASPQNYNSGRTLRGELARMHGNLEWRAHPRVLLQGGAMLEYHYFTGADLSPRAAVNLTLAPGHVVRLGVARAYRSPTFFEQRGNQVVVLQSGALVDAVTVPSDGLDPERVLSSEIGYVGQWRPARLELDVRLYRDRIDRFIGQLRGDFFNDVGSFRPNEFKFANIGSVDAHGGEIQLRWRPLPTLDVSAHYARVFLAADTVRQNFNTDIPLSAPRNSWGLLASYRMGNGWDASLFAQRSDAQKWLSEGDLTPAFTRVDARLARRWKWQGRDVEAAVVGQNLGDDYQEFRDTNTFSRRVYGSLSLAW